MTDRSFAKGDCVTWLDEAGARHVGVVVRVEDSTTHPLLRVDIGERYETIRSSEAQGFDEMDDLEFA